MIKLFHPIRRLCSWVASSIRSLWPWGQKTRKLQSFKGVVRLDSSVDPAHDLAAKRLVLVGPKDKPKWLRFQCPCGCGDVIALNLMTSHHPRWTVEVHQDGTLTAHPSVDAQTCKSHFWIRRSRIDWV